MEQKIKQDKDIGSNIRRLRYQKKLTQDQLAGKMQLLGCDTTRSSISKIEAGMQHIYVSELIAIKQILNISYEQIFD